MCLNENPSQSSNIVKPPIWVFTSCGVMYQYGTISKRLNLGKNLQHHEGWSKPLLYRNQVRVPFTWSLEIELWLVLTASLTELEDDNPTSKLIPDIANTVHLCRPNMIQPGKHLLLSLLFWLSSILGWNGMFNILFVVHTKIVELCQDLHRLRHIPFSSSGKLLYKR